MYSEIKSDNYYQTLKNCSVSFESNDFSFTDLKQIFHVTSEDGHFMQMLKICHALQGDQSKKLFVNPEEDIEVQMHIIEAFELRRYTYLIMTCSAIISNAKIKSEVIVKLTNILTKCQRKKVILVASSESKVVQEIGSKHITQIDGSVLFQDLVIQSPESLLDSTIVYFQGIAISMKKLLNTETIENCIKLLNLETLEKMVRKERIEVGKSVLDLDKNVAPYYIPRLFERNEARKINVFTEKGIFYVDEKVILIEGRAGMGKSTTLTNLAMTIKKESPHLWVIKIDLSDYTNALRSVKNNSGISSIIEMLDSQEATKFSNPFEKNIFSVNEKVILMMHGIDDIYPKYTGLIYDLISNCQQTSNFKKVFVATTSYLSRELEANLNIDSFKMQLFSKQNQIDFLTQYWVHNNLQFDNDICRCRQYAKTLIDKYFSMLQSPSYKENDVAAIPLQVKMLAEIFKQNVNRRNEPADCLAYKKRLNGNEKNKLLVQCNITKLYTMFIKKKRDVFINKMNSNGKTIAYQALVKEFEKCMDYHRILALELILGRKKSGLFSNYHRQIKYVENYILNIGIVQKSNDRLQFVHKTFAKYFVADSILKELQQHQTLKFQNFVINKILSNSEFILIHAFLDGFLQDSNFSSFDDFKLYENSSTKRNLGYRLEIEGFPALSRIVLKSIHLQPVASNTKVKCTKKRDKIRVSEENVLELGVDTSITENTDKTALHLRTEKGELDIPKLLPEIGADTISISDHKTQNFVANEDQLKLNQSVKTDENSNLDAVKLCKQFVAHINSEDACGRTALHLAVMYQELETVKSLAQTNVDLNVTDNEGRTALHLASQNGALDVFKYLLNLNVNINIRDINGRVPLHLAAEEGELEIIENLVNAGVNINARDDAGETPLHLAVKYGKLDTVECLVKHEADFDAKDNNGCTPLHLAVIYDEFDTVKFLVESGADFDIRDNKSRTAKYLAIEYDRLDFVNFLEKCEVDFRNTKSHTTKMIQSETINTINVKEENETFTVLHSAAFQGQFECIKYLIDHGVDLDIRSNESRTVLQLAALRGRLDIVEFFVSHNVDVDLRDSDGNTALRLAVDEDHLDIVKYLVDHDADINIIDGDGNTILHSAAECDRFLTVKYLVEEANANVNAKGNGDRTPLHLAVRWGNVDIVEFLLKHPDIKVNSTDITGRTPLHFAASRHSFDIVKLLVQNKANINVRDKDGCTALHLAARGGNFFCVDYLAGNENINITDSCGRTVLHLVAEEGEIYVVKSLVDKGADINIIDRNNCTALDLAESKGYIRVVEYLNEKLHISK